MKINCKGPLCALIQSICISGQRSQKVQLKTWQRPILKKITCLLFFFFLSCFVCLFVCLYKSFVHEISLRTNQGGMHPRFKIVDVLLCFIKLILGNCYGRGGFSRASKGGRRKRNVECRWLILSLFPFFLFFHSLEKEKELVCIYTYICIHIYVYMYIYI